MIDDILEIFTASFPNSFLLQTRTMVSEGHNPVALITYQKRTTFVSVCKYADTISFQLYVNPKNKD
ncbi:MAG TPA: hypothetical protein VGN64_08225, partial [Dyadobacter sp.]|nr:hypothetical protein [Dyadobacter sp.]